MQDFNFFKFFESKKFYFPVFFPEEFKIPVLSEKLG